jgi:hypothetical protein
MKKLGIVCVVVFLFFCSGGCHRQEDCAPNYSKAIEIYDPVYNQSYYIFENANKQMIFIPIEREGSH